jgi:hypothetical protein
MDHLLKALESILTFGGIAGIIGILITGSICTRYVKHGPEKIPEILTYALATIIGFYFGTAAPKPANQTAQIVPPAASTSATPR